MTHSSLKEQIIKESNPKLNPKNYDSEPSDYIGSGSFGEVIRIKSEKVLALKSINLKMLADTEQEIAEELSSAYTEYKILKKKLQNVVTSYDYYYDDREKIFSFSMDYIQGKSLAKYMEQKPQGMNIQEFFSIFKDIVTGNPIRIRT